MKINYSNVLLRNCEPRIFDSTIKRNEIMTTSNAKNLQVGDKITFTNLIGSEISITVSRVSEKSWYCHRGGRNSFGTLESYSKMKDFKIIKLTKSGA